MPCRKNSESRASNHKRIGQAGRTGLGAMMIPRYVRAESVRSGKCIGKRRWRLVMDMNITYYTPLLTALGQLGPHDHQSLIYEIPEDRFAVAIPFIRIGLDRGDKCVYIADDGTEAALRDAMSAQGIGVERAIATGSLVLATKDSAFLKHGSFDPEWMPTFWRAATPEGLHEAVAPLRP